MSDRSAHQLPAKPSKEKLAALQIFLGENKGRNVELDAHEVSTITGHQLEILMSGYKDWSQDGHDFFIVRCPEDIMTRLKFIGVPAQLFSEGS